MSVFILGVLAEVSFCFLHSHSTMKVIAEALNPNPPPPTPPSSSAPPPSENSVTVKFKTIKQAKEDLKGLYKNPVELWDENFVGEALSESDECHPENSSFAIGATGGVITGLVTGFFSPRRVHTPINTPIPSIFPRLHGLVSNSVILSSTAWRIAKRTLLGTILFSVLECDFKDLVAKREDKYYGSIAAGAVSGAIFGLRGGFRGSGIGLILFSSLPAAWEMYNRQKLVKPN